MVEFNTSPSWRVRIMQEGRKAACINADVYAVAE
ncbi:hypothetical protein Vi05172_g3949 [Venturia inaequalis]|nr:hypothetical protein Vi05172_g3949 [Venturia inaequalis]